MKLLSTPLVDLYCTFSSSNFRPNVIAWSSQEAFGPADVPHLDLFNAVHNEHVLKVLDGPIHPVVEGGSSLGELQVQLVNGL